MNGEGEVDREKTASRWPLPALSSLFWLFSLHLIPVWHSAASGGRKEKAAADLDAEQPGMIQKYLLAKEKWVYVFLSLVDYKLPEG